MPKGGNEFLVARANDGQVYSLQALVPPHVESVTFIAFDSSDSAARDAFWLSSAYLVGAALQEEHGTQLLLSGAPALASAGSGGAGFAYEYLLDARSDAERAQAVPGDAHEAVVELLEGQPSKPTSLSDAALVDLEKRVQSLVAANLPFEISSVPRAEAEELLADNPFKRERIASLGKNEVALLRLGNFVDLAPEGGALVPRTKAIKAFRLTEWSAATWTPSTPTSAYVPATQPLVRLRAVSFPKPAELKAHLSAQAAAAASDHRVVGRAQSLFLTHDMSPGSAFLLPHGMRLARKVERVVRDLYDVYGYDEVQTPLLFRQALWKQSGHWENYRDDMFAVEGFKEREERQAELLARSSSSVGIDSRMEGLNRTGCCAHSHEEPTDAKGAETAGAEFGLKPMNCPGHCLVFSSQERSYRELPIRYAEFSPLHR